MSDKKGSNNNSTNNADSQNKTTANNKVDTNVSTNISYSASSSSTASQKPEEKTTSKPSASEKTNAVTSKAEAESTSTKAPSPAPQKNENTTPSSSTKAVNAPAKSNPKTSKPKTAKAPNHTAIKVTAIAALVIATASVAASIGHFFYQQQQTNAQLLALSQKNQQAIQQSQKQLEQALNTQFSRELDKQNLATTQSQKNAQLAHNETAKQLQLIASQVGQLEGQMSQRDADDWLVHEAEYLVRIAARTMWLERDTAAAINLLRDADSRLQELNRPKLLPLRALINEDIESLALMPVLTNEEAILTLMALNKQIPSLTLSGVNLTEALDEVEEDFELSDDVNDWQENLARTWQKFVKDFISVRRRTGMVEPLMSPDQQQNLRQNISLKIQLAQWAASEQKNEVYQQTLLDIQEWLNEFFDMELAQNKRFYNAIEGLKSQTIYYDYPSDLASLTLMKRLLKETKEGKPTHSTKQKQQNKTEVQKQTDKTTAPKQQEKTQGGSSITPEATSQLSEKSGKITTQPSSPEKVNSPKTDSTATSTKTQSGGTL